MTRDQFVEQSMEYLREALKAHVRPGHQDAFSLILDEIERSRAPASTSKSRHGCFDSGLLCHTRMVCQVGFSVLGQTVPTLRAMAFPDVAEPAGFLLEDFSREIENLTHESVFKVSLLHDYNKVRTLAGTHYYVPNMLKNGTRSESKPWEISDDGEPFAAARTLLEGEEGAGSVAVSEFLGLPGFSCREGAVSLAAAFRTSPALREILTPEEQFAIVYHDGAYTSRTGLSNKESMLQQVLHFSDMIASRFLC